MVKKFNMVLCNRHRTQMLQHGKFMETKYTPSDIELFEDHAEVILRDNDCIEIARSVIDLNDVESIGKHRWCYQEGYAFTTINGKNIGMHRYLMNPPEGYVVDHINHNRLYNCQCNLRVVTQGQNNMNHIIQINNNSGYPGVHWNKNWRKWESRIFKNGETVFLGGYNNLDDAIATRKAAEKQYYGEFAYQEVN